MKRYALAGMGAAAAVLTLIAGPSGAQGTKEPPVVWVGSDQKPQVVLTDAQFTKLLAQDAKFLSEALAADKIEKTVGRKIQAAALMIHAYGDLSKHADSKAVSANGKTAYYVFREGNLALARLAAGALYPKVMTLKDTAKGPQKPALAGYMYVFASERVGGFGVEQELGELEEVKGKFSDAQFARLADLGLKIAVIGQMADRFAPPKEKDMATVKNWKAYAGELRQEAVGLADAAAAKNEAKTRKALEKLGETCVKCHDVFRP